MIILGLGSNLGDRLANLRSALFHIKQIPNLTISQISPVYISDALTPENASDDWNLPYLNLAIRCETSLTPYELLKSTKQIEFLIGRMPGKDWAPRLIDIDILAWNDLVQYDEQLHIPHENLIERPFALWPLADVAPTWRYPLPNQFNGKTASELVQKWGSRFTGTAPLRTKQIQQRIDSPQLVGILNLTPDSFSGDGKYHAVDEAVQHAIKLVEAGVEIIDIGAESTGPASNTLSSDVEWQRLEPVIAAVMSELPNMVVKPKISVDTRNPETAKNALNYKVDWINDVAGLTNPLMREIIVDSKCDVIFMHNLGIPVSLGKQFLATDDVVKRVYSWGEKQLLELEKWGIAKERLIFDVGIGYGDNPNQSIELIKHIHYFKKLNVRLLVGHSRKSFLQQFTQIHPSERDFETLVLSLYLAKENVDYLRVHNVDAHGRAFKVASVLA